MRNMILSTKLLKDALYVIDKTVNNNDITLIIERITANDTGRIKLNLDDDALEKFMCVQDK